MLQVVATADQAKLLAESNESFEIVDASGRRLGIVVRQPSVEDIQIAKQRIEQIESRFSTAEVIAHLRSLESP